MTVNLNVTVTVDPTHIHHLIEQETDNPNDETPESIQRWIEDNPTVINGMVVDGVVGYLTEE